MARFRDVPFVDIEDGRLRVFIEEGRDRWCEFSASKRGAEAAGRFLFRKDYRHWLYSSSVDFPTEYGAPDLDFRQLVLDGFNEAASEKNKTQTQTKVNAQWRKSRKRRNRKAKLLLARSMIPKR